MAWTLIGEDTFTTGSDTNLNVWTPTGTTPLSGWTKLTSQISAQAVVKAADDTLCQPYHSGTANPNPYTISNSVNSGAQKSEATGVTSSNRGLVLHGVNAATYWNGYYARYNVGISAFEILRVDNGVRTQLTTGRVGSAPVAGDVVTFESDGAGALLVANNGTTQCSTTSATYTAGKPGIAVEKSFTGTGLDNYKAYHVAGAATHPSSGVLAGTGSSIDGAASHSALHSASGILTGAGADITGSSAHETVHQSSGELAGQSGSISGAATHIVPSATHTTSGALSGAGSAIDGAASLSGGTGGNPVVHGISGDLVGSASDVSGVSRHGVPGDRAEKLIYAALTASGSVIALVGQKIYPMIAPQSVTGKHITYQRISTDLQTRLDGLASIAKVRIQISCWGETYLDAVNLAKTARAAILSDSSFSSRAVFSADDFDAETRQHRVIIDFVVWQK